MTADKKTPSAIDPALFEKHQSELVTALAKPERSMSKAPLYYGVDEILLDWSSDGTSTLRLSLNYGRAYLDGFWVHMAGKPGVFAHFSFLGSVKGQMLFSADEWRLESDPPPCQSGRPLRLRGPFRKGTQDGL